MRRRGAIIRDPVHGDIELTGEELALLDTPDMQRLRGVRQLGTAYLVFPGAQHTRFEHSLGTLHVAQQMIDAINRSREGAPLERIGVADDEARIVRAAALVHDVTHIPFGHGIEDQSGLLERHDSPERFRRALGPDTALGRALDAMGIRREVLAVLLPPGAEDVPDVPAYWREILSDTICADILDYLRRDAFYTGLNLFYDPRVMQYFMVDRASGHLYVDVAKRGLLREDILSEIVRVLEARYFFSERVYYHHAKIAASALIAQLVENALEHGGLAPSRLAEQTDDSLRGLLRDHLPEAPAVRARQLELLDRLASRRLLKRACVFPRYANADAQDGLVERFFARGRHAERQAFEAAVVEALGRRGMSEPPLVMLYCPARRMQLKEAQTHVRFPGASAVEPLSAFQSRIPRLADLEQRYRDLWKLYVLAGTDDWTVLATIGEIVRDLLPEATNVYRPKDA